MINRVQPACGGHTATEEVDCRLTNEQYLKMARISTCVCGGYPAYDDYTQGGYPYAFAVKRVLGLGRGFVGFVPVGF